MRLARVGIENVIGYVKGGIEDWVRTDRQLSQVPQISVLHLHQLLCQEPSEIQVVDVRRPGEWEAGHIARATLKPLNRFALGTSEGAWTTLDPAKPIAIHCKSGYRSSIATSLLERAGYPIVMNVTGGFDAWQAQKLPIERPGCA